MPEESPKALISVKDTSRSVRSDCAAGLPQRHGRRCAGVPLEQDRPRDGLAPIKTGRRAMCCPSVDELLRASKRRRHYALLRVGTAHAIRRPSATIRPASPCHFPPKTAADPRLQAYPARGSSPSQAKSGPCSYRKINPYSARRIRHSLSPPATANLALFVHVDFGQTAVGPVRLRLEVALGLDTGADASETA